MYVGKLPSGRWQAKISIGKDEKGKYKYKSFTSATKKGAQNAAALYMIEHEEAKGSFASAANRFIDSRSPLLSPATIRAYKFMLKRLASASFWDKNVNSINNKDVQLYVLEMAASSLSVKTMRNYIGLITAILSAEDVKLGKIVLPQAKKTETFMPDEKLMKEVAAASVGSPLEIEIGLGLCGLRRSEVCGLSIDDLEGSEIHIHTAAVYDYDFKIHKKQPKTYESDRRITIPKRIAELIRKQGYVTKRTPNGLSNAFARFLKSNGFPPFRFHTLRAFFASYAADLGLSEAQILKMGGWATASIYKRNYRRAMNQTEANKKYIDSFF